MSAGYVILGCDPSSKKLAAVITRRADMDDAEIRVALLPTNKNKVDACEAAFLWMQALVSEMRARFDVAHVHVFIESPVLGRGGPAATIPQAQVNGALLAGAKLAHADSVTSANNTHVKKAIVGKGNATKEDIASWCQADWPDLYDGSGGDQDVIDAAMVNRYGAQVLALRSKVSAGKVIKNQRIRKAVRP